MTRKTILVAPMDWGLGHATRCIPLIRELLQRHCKVIVGGSGLSLELLRKEFPLIEFVTLAAYSPVYSASSSLVLKMAEQLVKFLLIIQREHRQVQRLIKERAIDVVISDNRFGCWSVAVKTVFITHQLTIQLPKGFSWLAGPLNYFNRRAVSKFSECWVPDIQGENNLTGILSAAGALRVRYVGAISRFAKPVLDAKKKYDIAAILSGPEPQRSMLEDMLLNQFSECGLRCILVRGDTKKENSKELNNITVVDMMDSAALQEVMEQSSVILSRSGYTTIMDLAQMGKKAILIPTPGQTEQEYLAQRLDDVGIAFRMTQDKFNLRYALERVHAYSGFNRSYADKPAFTDAIERILQ